MGLNDKWNSDLADSVHDFVLEWSALPSPEVSGREEQAEWKVVIGDGVQDGCKEALCPECSFSRNGAAMC